MMHMQKTCAKFNVLTKASVDTNPERRRLIINAFISHNKILHNKII